MAKLSPNPDTARFIEGIKEFSQLGSSPEFKQIMADFLRYEFFWDSKELSGPFRATLSDAEKIAALSKFWSEVKYNFAYPEKLIELGWDRLYLDSIPKVLAARTTGDYYRELALLCVKLSDGHTNLYPPDELDQSAKPPIRTLEVGDRVMIVEVRSPALQQKGIKAGMDIVKVDGELSLDYGRRTVEPLQSAATPQDRELRTFSYGFLRGARATPVRLLVRDSWGVEKELTVDRTG